MFLFYVLSFFKNGDTNKRGTLFKGGGELFKEIWYLYDQTTFGHLDRFISNNRYLVDVLWGQPNKLIQVVFTSEFHEY